MGFQAIQALPIGQTSSNGALASLLGTTVWKNGVQYMLVKCDTAAITAGATNVIKWKTGQAATGFIVDAVATAALAAGACAGIPILPTGVTAVPLSSYVWVARRGPVTALTAGAVAAGLGLAVHGAAGSLDDTTVTYDTVVARALDAIGSATTGTVYMLLG
jgi:hypothetical protein